MNADALLAAIREAPDDDAPRLVYADWLEEHGDEQHLAHAELIRVQVELARLPIDDDRRAELRERERRLQRAHVIVERLGFPYWVDSETVRGFPEMLQPPQRWQPSEPDLAIMAQMIDRLPIRGLSAELSDEGLKQIAEWPALARLTCLEATTGISLSGLGRGVSGLNALADSPFAGNLRRLRLGRRQYDPETLGRLGNSPHLPRLNDVQLGGYDDHNTFVSIMALSVSSLSTRLERLDLAWVEVAPLSVSVFLKRAPLRELRVGVPEDLGVRGLLRAKGLSRLRVLDVTGEEHGFDVDELPDARDHRPVPDLTKLLSSPRLTGLEELSLRGIMLGDDGARALAGAPMARNLVRLRLDLCGLSGDGLRALRPLLADGRLRELSLGHNVFTREDARDLASWPELGRLHALDLGYFNHVGDDGRAALEASPHRHPHSRFG
jgi:uncharacterized protein (TIGR02996 family)